MKYCRTSAQVFAVSLAFGLGPAAAFAQGNHFGALYEWMRNTEEAARFVDKGDYVKAEQRLNLAIKEIRPYLPESVYLEVAGRPAAQPYWLIGSRRPAELAAAIETARSRLGVQAACND